MDNNNLQVQDDNISSNGVPQNINEHSDSLFENSQEQEPSSSDMILTQCVEPRMPLIDNNNNNNNNDDSGEPDSQFEKKSKKDFGVQTIIMFKPSKVNTCMQTVRKVMLEKATQCEPVNYKLAKPLRSSLCRIGLTRKWKR